MRWRLKSKDGADHLVELIRREDDRYFFLVNGEEVVLSSPKIFAHSLETAENQWVFEAWTKDRWRAISGYEVIEVSPICADLKSGQNEREIKSQMPGRVLKLAVKEGDAVKKGASLFIIEAMKMENDIRANADAIVESIHVTEGQSVETGTLLIRLK